MQQGKIFRYSRANECGIIALDCGDDLMYEFRLKDWEETELPQVGMHVQIIDKKITLTEFNESIESPKKGKIFSFDSANGNGLILLSNGEKFNFNVDNWSIPQTQPVVGMVVFITNNKVTSEEIQKTKKEIEIEKMKERANKAGLIVLVIFSLFAILVFYAVSNGSNTSSTSTYRSSESGCYDFGYKAGSCFQRSSMGKQCKAGTDIVIPERCRNKYSTDKGFKAGAASER